MKEKCPRCGREEEHYGPAHMCTKCGLVWRGELETEALTLAAAHVLTGGKPPRSIIRRRRRS